jgi:hypothetical protein
VTDNRDWRAYEEQIHERLLRLAGLDAEVTFDARLPGKLSGVERQVDIFISGTFANVGTATMAVDCKCFSRKVDVKNVEMAIGLVEDVGSDLGLIVTTEGFSAGAKRRAKAVRGITLDVVPYDDLADWEPDVEWCKVCTDPTSERFPGGVYMAPLDRRKPPEGGELVTEAGRCELCESVHVRLVCGTMNAADETQHGEWVECECGCGTEWRVDVEVDRDGIPLSSDVADTVRFRVLSV